MPAVQPQPSTVVLSFKSILTLPFRLCNPPPAVGRVRSCAVTPLFNVRLDDVLDRKHLPPLGLKDFEEWLLYVEMCPENLYFILWLREYHSRYVEWQKQRNSPKDAVGASNAASRLAVFYSRAKQTFFTPDAQYELNLPSVTLAPFHKPDQDPHPDPSLFRPVETETKRMLEQSLRRFIHAQMNNVGNSRVLCGIVAGIVIIIIGSLPPVVTNFVVNQSRWLRLTAVPGMWLGLTILLCALHGVCLGVYIFGDLRQLRKFELARPPTSKHTLPCDSRPRIPPHPAVYPPSPPKPAHTRSRCHSQPCPHRPISSAAASLSEYSDGCSVYSHGAQSIQLTPIYIETNPIDGPSTCPILVEYCSPQNDAEWLRQQELQKELQKQKELEREPSSPDSFTSTATFISPFCSPSVTDTSGYWDNEELLSVTARWYRIRAKEDLEKLGNESSMRQPLAEFDFDGLPPPPIRPNSSTAARGGKGTGLVWEVDEEQGRWRWFLNFVDRVQTRCSFKKWGPTPGAPGSGPVFLGGVPPYLSSRSSSSKKSKSRINLRAASKSTLSISTCSTAHDTETSERAKKRNRLVNSVPAFAVPLTKVLNPIIVRGQWEIVVRSAGLALLVTWVVCGSLLAIPVR